MTLEQIVLEGRMDYAKGFGLHQNPYCLFKRMPRATGEDFHAWHQKINAWEAGWSEAASEQQVASSKSLLKQKIEEQNSRESYR